MRQFGGTLGLELGAGAAGLRLVAKGPRLRYSQAPQDRNGQRHGKVVPKGDWRRWAGGALMGGAAEGQHTVRAGGRRWSRGGRWGRGSVRTGEGESWCRRHGGRAAHILLEPDRQVSAANKSPGRSCWRAHSRWQSGPHWSFTEVLNPGTAVVNYPGVSVRDTRPSESGSRTDRAPMRMV